LGRYSEEECLLGPSVAKVKRPDLPSKAALQTILLRRINIRRE